jgi:hypothetical protein
LASSTFPKFKQPTSVSPRQGSARRSTPFG